VNTGCATQQVAPATLNCTSSWSAGRSQARRQPARSRARTLDGELARMPSPQQSDTLLNYQPRGLNYLFAVGPAITGRPPHRSVRAEFPHTAPTLGV
jgi:hypothetical protein